VRPLNKPNWHDGQLWLGNYMPSGIECLFFLYIYICSYWNIIQLHKIQFIHLISLLRDLENDDNNESWDRLWRKQSILFQKKSYATFKTKYYYLIYFGQIPSQKTSSKQLLNTYSFLILSIQSCVIDLKISITIINNIQIKQKYIYLK